MKIFYYFFKGSFGGFLRRNPCGSAAPTRPRSNPPLFFANSFTLSVTFFQAEICYTYYGIIIVTFLEAYNYDT